MCVLEKSGEGCRYSLKIVNAGKENVDLASLDLSFRLWLGAKRLHVVWSRDVGAVVLDKAGNRLGDFALQRHGRRSTAWTREEWAQGGRYANQMGDIPLQFASGVSILPPGGCVQGLMVGFQRFGEDPQGVTEAGDHCARWDASFTHYSGP